MPYITVDKARELLSLELEESDIPSDNRLSLMIERVEKYLNHWLGRSLLPTLYKDILQCTRYGKVSLREYPVLAVVEVKHILPSVVKDELQDQLAKELDPKEAGYDEYRRNQASGYRLGDTIVDTGITHGWVEVIYWAGYDPLPTILEDVIVHALSFVINEGSATALMRPLRQVTSQSLPGGLSQSFKLPDSRKDDYYFLDFFFSPLEKYKKLFKY